MLKNYIKVCIGLKNKNEQSELVKQPNKIVILICRTLPGGKI